MMKLLIFFVLTSMAAYSQSENAVKFQVEFQEIKVAAQGGGFTDWKELGNISKETDQTITINFTNRTLASDIKLQGQRREFNTYRIVSYSHDKSLADFGFFTTTMKVDEGQGKVFDYKLAYTSRDKSYTLIRYTSLAQTRYSMKEL